MLRATIIFQPKSRMHRGALYRIAHFSGAPTHGSAFVALLGAAINNPAHTGPALDGLPFGTVAARPDVICPIAQDKPYRHYAWIAAAVDIGETQEGFVLTEGVKGWGQGLHGTSEVA